MKRYMKCLRDNNNGSHMCRTESKDYLQCRMDRYAYIDPFHVRENVSKLEDKTKEI